VTFTDKSFGNIDSYLWEFDDGSTSTERTPPPRTYTNIRTYRVKLTVTSAGGSDAKTIPIQVVEPVVPPGDLKTSMVRQAADQCGNTRDPWRFGLTWEPVMNARHYQVSVFHLGEDGACSDTLYTQVVQTAGTEVQITRCPDCGDGGWQWAVQSGNYECGSLWSEPSEIVALYVEPDPMARLDSVVTRYRNLRDALAMTLEDGAWEELADREQEARDVRGDLGFLIARNAREPFLDRQQRAVAEDLQDELRESILLLSKIKNKQKYKIEIVRTMENTELSLIDDSAGPILYTTPAMDVKMDFVLFARGNKYYMTMGQDQSVTAYTKIGVNETPACVLDPEYGILQLALGNCPQIGDGVEVYIQNEGWELVRDLIELADVPDATLGRN